MTIEENKNPLTVNVQPDVETEKLDAIIEKLAAIESLLQRLPEIQAVAMLQLYDEYQSAQLQGRSASDLWTIPPPGER